jgi:hypothetical protein
MTSDAGLYDIRLREVEADDLPIFFEHQRDPDANHMAAFTSKDPTNRDAFLAHWARASRPGHSQLFSRASRNALSMRGSPLTTQPPCACWRNAGLSASAPTGILPMRAAKRLKKFF